jgi:hypothetical protein
VYDPETECDKDVSVYIFESFEKHDVYPMTNAPNLGVIHLCEQDCCGYRIVQRSYGKWQEYCDWMDVGCPLTFQDMLDETINFCYKQTQQNKFTAKVVDWVKNNA